MAARVEAEGLNRAETVEMVRKEFEGKAVGAGGVKGRGPGKDRPKHPTERTVRTSGGIKVIAQARKGFDVLTWVEALREALEQATAKLEPVAD